MKISLFVSLILIASVVFIGFNLVVDDFETHLINTGYVNTAPFNDSYDMGLNQTSSIQKDFRNTVTGFQSLGDEDEWYDKLGDFIGAIPILIIQFPIVAFLTIADATENINIVLNEIGIPSEIVIILGIGIITWVVFKLINFWKSGKEL